MSVRIVHTADLHLGSRMSSMGDCADDFREALVHSFDTLLEKTAASEAAILLIAGDFLEMNEIREREVTRIASLLRRERPFYILLAAGNHDHYTAASAYAEELADIPGFHIFAAGDIERIDFPEHDVSVYGASFSSLYQTSTILPVPGQETRVWVGKWPYFSQ